MAVLIVCIALVVLALVVLAALAHQLLGAFGRLTREVSGLQQEVAPVVADLQQTLARAAAQREARTPAPGRPAVLDAGPVRTTSG